TGSSRCPGTGPTGWAGPRPIRARARSPQRRATGPPSARRRRARARAPARRSTAAVTRIATISLQVTPVGRANRTGVIEWGDADAERDDVGLAGRFVARQHRAVSAGGARGTGDDPGPDARHRGADGQQPRP